MKTFIRSFVCFNDQFVAVVITTSGDNHHCNKLDSLSGTFIDFDVVDHVSLVLFPSPLVECDIVWIFTAYLLHSFTVTEDGWTTVGYLKAISDIRLVKEYSCYFVYGLQWKAAYFSFLPRPRCVKKISCIYTPIYRSDNSGLVDLIHKKTIR